MGKARHPHDATRPARQNVVLAIAADDIEEVIRCLSVRQRRFAEEYVIDFNGTAAAIRAGYATKWADRQSHLLRNNKGVSFYIDHLTKTKVNKIMSVDPDYVIQRVTAIIDGSTRDGDKLRGLELLARHLGMFTDKAEITTIDPAKEAEAEAAREFTALMRQLQDRSDSIDDSEEEEVTEVSLG